MNIRIANWNIERPLTVNKKTTLVLNKIIEINADVIVLTESSNAIDLTNIYPFSQSTLSYPRTPNEHWVSIWSKYPITNKINTFDEYRTTSCIIETPFPKIIIYGTIIPYHMAGVSGIRYGNLNLKPWQFHEDDLYKQAEDWKIIKNQFNDLPLFIVGDFNQTRGTNEGYGTKKVRDVLTDILTNNNLICLTEQKDIESFLSVNNKTGKKRKNIDHICSSIPFIQKIKSYNVGAWDYFNADNVNLSDHNGVYVDFEL